VLEPDRASLGRYVHVPVVRYKRSLANDSYVGLLYAARELEHTNNRVVGFDEQYRVSDASVLESNGFLTSAKDDPSAAAVGGHTFGARFAHGTRDLDYSLNFREVSENFRADMGYYTRTGVVNVIGFLRSKVYPQSALFQRIEFELATGQTKDRVSGLWETGNDLAFNIFFGGSWLYRTRFNYSTEVFDGQIFQTSGVHSQLRGQITKQISVNFLHRRIRATYYPASEQGKSNVVNATLTLQPWDNFRAEGSFIYSDFFRDADDAKLYDYPITRLKVTYQVNQYLFFRTIGEYNDFRKVLTTDVLASFTYIPGTAVFLGYGSVFEKVLWDGSGYVPDDSFLEMRRGLFLKMSYLWRS
jgi:hypothetical protein